MLNPTCFENSRPDGFPVLEVVVAKGRRQFVPLRRSELRGDLAGPMAALRLTQVFGYSAAECGRTLEAAYRFPMPGNAAVTGVRVRFGEVSIRAELAERGRAEARYEEARREGRRAALATRESPDVFTLRVAGLRPDEEVTVEVVFVQLARPEGPGWSLRIPLTTAPRYVRNDEAGSRPAEGQPLAMLRDPGHRFALDLTLRGAVAVSSPTHPLEVARDLGRARIRLRDGEVVPDRDCVVTWQPEGQSDRPTLDLLLHDEPASGFVYFLAMVAPPAARDPGKGAAREVVLLVDHSGSMGGDKWQAADWAVERFLSDLSDRDSFALGLFHTTTRWFDRSPRRATPEAVAEAVAFLKAHRDPGGTELGVALEQALGVGRTGGESARHVLIVTDAEVTDEGRILRLADIEARRPDRRRISVLCIDAAPNAHLAHELADRGGGVARFLTSDPEEGDIATALDEVLADWAEPVLIGLRLEGDRPDVRASGRESVGVDRPGWSGVDLGDLPAGRPVWVVGRAPRGESPTMDFRLVTAKGHELARARELAAEAPEGPALKALFGARAVLGLEHLIGSRQDLDGVRAGLIRLGYDPDPVLKADPTVYAENAGRKLAETLRDLLAREALGFGLASSETAFIATRAEAGQVVEGTVEVANALPAGWSGGFASGTVGMMVAASSRGGGGYGGGGSFGGAPMARLSMPFPPDSVDSMMMEFHDLAPSAAAPPPPASAGPPRSARENVIDSLAESAPSPDPAPPSKSIGSKVRDFLRAPAKPAPPPSTIVHSGVPAMSGGEAILFDSTRDLAIVLPETIKFGRIEVRFPDGPPGPRTLDPGLFLLIYIDDLASPRARVRLADLVRAGGVRPLNLARGPGQVVRVVLADPAGSWAAGAPRLEVALGW